MSRDESPPTPERGAAAPEAERQDARDRESEVPPDLTVVGIGASAGGLAALKELLGRVPADSGLAWVVVVHLSPEHESHLSDLLQPDLSIPVEQVTTTLPLEPDRVYVIPPNANLEAVDTHLRLSELEERREKRAPVDHFFRTLARTYDGRAIGVVLTGTGSDGALGMKEIKEKGGLTVVQRPEEAEYPGMPRSALATGLVDLELPLARIPEAAVRYVATRPRVKASRRVPHDAPLETTYRPAFTWRSSPRIRAKSVKRVGEATRSRAPSVSATAPNPAPGGTVKETSGPSPVPPHAATARRRTPALPRRRARARTRAGPVGRRFTGTCPGHRATTGE